MTTTNKTQQSGSESCNAMELGFRSILNTALEQPGILSQAYKAFHRFSMGNQMLAAVQLMNRGLSLSPIASFMAWKEKGRMVKKGQKAISLFMPVSGKGERENKETGEKEAFSYSRFILRPHWFSLDQTEGEDFAPEIKIPEWDAVQALAVLEIMEEKYDNVNGNVQGYAREKSIAINPMAWFKHKTRFHELAHVVLGHTQAQTMTDSEHTPPALAEVEAEGVAYLLCVLLDLPGQTESRGYIQNWSEGNEIPERSAQKIFSAAQKILAAGQQINEAETAV
jgi:hypothetical protein